MARIVREINRVDTTEGTYAYSETISSRKGFIYCEEVCVKELKEELLKSYHYPTPFYLYSKQQLVHNINSYKMALENQDIPYILGFSIKANYNPSLLEIMKSHGCAAIAVSGTEVQLAMKAGVAGHNIVLNGNGKLRWEIDLAIENGCFLNVDSAFDLAHTISSCKKLRKTANVILRLNPDIDPRVHPYLATGLAKSKFGIEDSQLRDIIATAKEEPLINLVGLHCHLGSTIDKTQVFSECLDVMLKLVTDVRQMGITTLKYVNVGGGLSIDYKKHSHRTCPHGISKETETKEPSVEIPTPRDLIDVVAERLKTSRLTVILEPGRSLIGNACLLVCDVVGWKANGDKNYLVIDGSMNEVIRPSLYDAYHHIELTEPVAVNKKLVYDVVGPICECADFLGKERLLPVPHEGCGIVVFDVGAYCGSMAANYNLRGRPAELLVDGNSWTIIRRPETLDDIMACMAYTKI